MKEINMGGFENQKVGVIFAGNRYEIELDAPAEIYRKFLTLPRPTTDADWNKVKKWVALFIGHYNDINQKKFKESLTKVAVIKFIEAYKGFLTEGVDTKKALSQTTHKETKTGSQ